MTQALRQQDLFSARPVGQIRADRGQMSYQAGMAAERSVADHYLRAGHILVAERWRGTRGEIDLVFSGPDGLVLVEVKKSKSFDHALALVSPAQVRRLFATAEEFAATQPLGLLTDLRFDLALVDAQGVVQVMENAFCHGY